MLQLSARFLYLHGELADMGNDDMKALAARFAIILAVFFLVLVPVGWYAWSNSMIGQLFILAFLAIVLANAHDYFTKGARTMWIFDKTKQAGWYKVDTALEMVPGEKITFPVSPAYIRMSGLAGYSAMPRDIIITNMRVAIGFDYFGIKEVFGELNLWRPGLKAIPKTKKKYADMAPFGDVAVKEAVLGKDGKSALVTVSQMNIKMQAEIYHPKAREIVELLGK